MFEDGEIGAITLDKGTLVFRTGVWQRRSKGQGTEGKARDQTSGETHIERDSGEERDDDVRRSTRGI